MEDTTSIFLMGGTYRVSSDDVAWENYLPASNIRHSVTTLCTFHDLVYLGLHGFRVTGKSLARILRNMPRLLELNIWTCNGRLDMPLGAGPFPIKILNLDDYNEGMTGLRFEGLVSNCPELEKLIIRNCRDSNTALEESIAIGKYCPKLRVMDFTAEEEHDGANWIPDLITNAPLGLEEICLYIQDIQDVILDAMSHHFQNLVKFSLTTYLDEQNLHTVYLTILTRCPKLQELRGYGTMPDKCSGIEEFLDREWVCTDLRILELQGLDISLYETEDLPEYWEMSQADINYDSNPSIKPTKCWSDEAQAEGQVQPFHLEVLEQVAWMCNIQEVVINDMKFTPTPYYEWDDRVKGDLTRMMETWMTPEWDESDME
ncbi:hypothetical protein BGZ50_007563 [Haplosporangium sp. Z 11]|nr:hypothetical protein BGZ50_007563 [Haplosporangium sp. Z 11]